MLNETMEDPNSHSPSLSLRERCERFMEASCGVHFCIGPNPLMARYVYGIFFLVTNVLAWTIRDYGHTALSELQRLKDVMARSSVWVLKAFFVSVLAVSCSFFVMFLSTAGSKKLSDPRNSWHSEWWLAKIIMWLVLLTIPFLVPPTFIDFYGKLAHFGAGVFLVIQLISVISFITWLNDCFQSEKNAERCRIQATVISIVAYVASLLGIISMYIWYAPKPSSNLNVLFITLTLGILQVITFVSLHPKVNAGLLAPGLMGVYIVFLCWCAIRSEPQADMGNKVKAAAATNADWVTIVSFVIAVLVIAIATFSTGIDSKCLQFKKREPESEDDVPYGYGFFHFVFAVGAMYFGMLFVAWNPNKTVKKWTIDVGWASTWVRASNEWLAAIIYVWMLVAPLVWKRWRVESG